MFFVDVDMDDVNSQLMERHVANDCDPQASRPVMATNLLPSVAAGQSSRETQRVDQERPLLERKNAFEFKHSEALSRFMQGAKPVEDSHVPQLHTKVKCMFSCFQFFCRF